MQVFSITNKKTGGGLETRLYFQPIIPSLIPSRERPGNEATFDLLSAFGEDIVPSWERPGNEATSDLLSALGEDIVPSWEGPGNEATSTYSLHLVKTVLDTGAFNFPTASTASSSVIGGILVPDCVCMYV